MENADAMTAGGSVEAASAEPAADEVVGAITASAAALVEKWSRISASTEAVDRSAAEAAVAELYSRGGVAPPRRFIWCASPLEAARLVAGTGADADARAAEAGQFGESLRDELRSAPWQRARAELLARLGRAALWAQV